MRGTFWLLFLIALSAMLAMALSGCAIVQVHVADAGDVKTRVYPFGVKVEPQAGAAEGVYVRSGNIGLVRGGGVISGGINDIEIYTVDADVCALGMVGHASAETIAAAKESAFICLSPKENTP